MAIILPFKNRRQLETENAVKVMGEWKAYLKWEEENRHYVKENMREEHILSEEEIGWLNEWVGEEK